MGCSVAGCTSPHRARGLCNTHYHYLRRHNELPQRPFKTECTVDGCEEPHEARGLCHLHYARWWKTGSTEVNRPTALDRFWAKVDKDGPASLCRPDLGPCWLWTASHNVAGHGTFWSGKRPIGAHVFIYQHMVGPVPDRYQLDHLCRTPACVNWNHVEPVTASVNNRRGGRGGVTHCPRGHAYDETNTYTDKRGHRSCKKCKVDAARRYQERKRAQS